MVEFLVIPGITIAGIAGTLFIVGGIVVSYYFKDNHTANIITICTLAMIIVAVVIGFKTKTWERFGLKKEIDGHATEDVAKTFKVGDKGTTVSRLAPIGNIIINDIIVEARSLGGFIDPNTNVVIVRTEMNKLFVEPLK
jgi:membrane-bound ClpP family serine protease